MAIWNEGNFCRQRPDTRVKVYTITIPSIAFVYKCMSIRVHHHHSNVICQPEIYRIGVHSEQDIPFYE